MGSLEKGYLAEIGFDPMTCGLWAHRADHCATLLLITSNDVFYMPSLKKAMRPPGIEPGSNPWEGSIMPLDHGRLIKG